MEITLVVDGYNAINAIPGMKKDFQEGKLEEARKKLHALVKEYARSSGYITGVRIVFDGDDRYRYLDALDITRNKEQVFSATGKGDEKVIDTVRRCSRFGAVVLASNDNYVRNNSRSYNASIIAVEDLAKKKIKYAKKRKVTEKKISQALSKKITDEYRKELEIE
ncbi:MAG: NYN domain-containing protein [Candidatus Omnitrophica bacterium]|nr:NYN domain-containing protein [Candidatus Omnitrophota bacterium]